MMLYLLHALLEHRVASGLTDDDICPLHDHNTDKEGCMAGKLHDLTLFIRLCRERNRIYETMAVSVWQHIVCHCKNNYATAQRGDGYKTASNSSHCRGALDCGNIHYRLVGYTLEIFPEEANLMSTSTENTVLARI